MGTPWVSFDGKDCSGCKHLNERGYCEFTGCIIPCMLRATIPEVKPQTNADRVRAMTDEELAHFLEMKAGRFVSFYPTQAKSWLDWLRQEVKDGT